MKTTKSITPFDIVLVPFPFSDQKATKQRPCLVLLTLEPKGLPTHYIVCMITSQIENGLTFPADILLKEHESAGLPKPSLVRLAKMVTVDGTLLRKKMGALSISDRKLVSHQFGALFRTLIK